MSAPARALRVRGRRAGAAVRRPADLRRDGPGRAGLDDMSRTRSVTSRRSVRPGIRPTRRHRPAQGAAQRDQARLARPDCRVGHRQHLCRRGAVAGPGPRRAAVRHAGPPSVGSAPRTTRGRSWARPWPRAARASTRSTSTSTAPRATSTGRWRHTGRKGRPCPRCGTLIVREHFMNRSSFFCPQCQPLTSRGLRAHLRLRRVANRQLDDATQVSQRDGDSHD
jgi:hypothetical protein